nr:hypothetical protein CFP56_59632 [Quercus suber]
MASEMQAVTRRGSDEMSRPSQNLHVDDGGRTVHEEHPKSYENGRVATKVQHSTAPRLASSCLEALSPFWDGKGRNTLVMIKAVRYQSGLQ